MRTGLFSLLFLFVFSAKLARVCLSMRGFLLSSKLLCFSVMLPSERCLHRPRKSEFCKKQLKASGDNRHALGSQLCMKTVSSQRENWCTIYTFSLVIILSLFAAENFHWKQHTSLGSARQNPCLASFHRNVHGDWCSSTAVRTAYHGKVMLLKNSTTRICTESGHHWRNWICWVFWLFSLHSWRWKRPNDSGRSWLRLSGWEDSEQTQTKHKDAHTHTHNPPLKTGQVGFRFWSSDSGLWPWRPDQKFEATPNFTKTPQNLYTVETPPLVESAHVLQPLKLPRLSEFGWIFGGSGWETCRLI